MHPQIKLPEAGQCPICFMDLIPVESENTGAVPTELRMSAAAMKLAEITTEAVRRGFAQKEILLSGKVEYDETRLGNITAWVPGRLEKLYVNYTGIAVTKGEPLVELYSPSLYAAQEELLQARKQYENSRTNPAREMAGALLQATRNKLELLGLTREQIAEIEERGTSEERITILSPMSGVVVHKSAFEGLFVDTGTNIYTIADLTQVWVVLDAYESDLPWLAEGQRVSLSATAIPDRIFQGTVMFIDPLLNAETRTVRVRLNIDNSHGLLKPGMFVRATVHSILKNDKGRESQHLKIPKSAVLRTGKRAVVYVKKAGNGEPTFESREIELGARAGDFYLVLAGLREGEEVVVKGNFKIDSAMQITAKPSMMNPGGGGASSGYDPLGGRPGQIAGIAEKPGKAEKTTPGRSSHAVEALAPVYAAYFRAQTALANDDFSESRMAFINFDEHITSLDHTTLKLGNQAEYELQRLKDELHKVTQHASHWSSIEEVRAAFEPISYAMLSMVGYFGHNAEISYYETFCPMAFDNKGAPWLQTEKIINNPYFGSAMLRCGEIKKEFKSINANSRHVREEN